uniref:Uncharacterized protein n=2 Tax=Parascaris univalens TaxID=6257 RepID=A0A915C252_PARUN
TNAVVKVKHQQHPQFAIPKSLSCYICSGNFDFSQSLRTCVEIVSLDFCHSCDLFIFMVPAVCPGIFHSLCGASTTVSHDLWRRMPSMCVYDGKYQNIGSVVSLGVRSERYLSLRERCDSISGGCNNWSVLRLLYHLV